MRTEPVWALLGQTNAGKSSLFNALLHQDLALVRDEHGVTRDWQYGRWVGEKGALILMDTPGLWGVEDPMLDRMLPLLEAEFSACSGFFWVIDASLGVSPLEHEWMVRLRKFGNPIILLLNKIDKISKSAADAVGEAYALGVSTMLEVSATTRRGFGQLRDTLEGLCLDANDPDRVSSQDGAIRLCILGRPNVGKSTLVNRILGRERMLTDAHAGTTRDAVEVVAQRKGRTMILTDTAGVRRRAQVDPGLEQMSVVKSLQQIASSDVVVVVLDSALGVVDQDQALLDYAYRHACAMVIALNKWELVASSRRQDALLDAEDACSFADNIEKLSISAKHGTGVGILLDAAFRAYEASQREYSTPDCTRILEAAVNKMAPPLVKGRRVRLRYAHMGARRPLTFVIHGKQTAALPGSYQRYLKHYFSKALKLEGVPLRLHFVTDHNPYADER